MSVSNHKKEIICTLGPASSSPEVLLEMARSGMTILRVNCSHYEPAIARQLIAFLRIQNRAVRILLDLQGPRIRVASRFPEKSIRENQLVQFVSEINFVLPRSKDVIPIPLALDFPFASLATATTVYMKDGTLAFDAVENRAAEGYIIAKTRWGGPVRGEKAINVPGLPPPPSALTEKDRADLKFSAEVDADAVMLSFVNKADDIRELEVAWGKIGARHRPQLWAKIETKDGIEHLSEIGKSADAFLIGRGDLAVEIGQFEAPAAQSQILETAQNLGIPCFVATQVLESMRTNPYPSRAEMRDIYVSLREGAAGFVLTAETSVGRYPLQAIGVLSEMIGRYSSSQRPRDTKPRKARTAK